MKKAIDQCYKALEEKEVPVGCVFVHIPSKIIFVESHNLTNKFKNWTNYLIKDENEFFIHYSLSKKNID